MNRLAMILEQKGIRPSDLARRMGVHRQTLFKQMEKDELPQKWAEMIAPYLNMTPQQLIYGNEATTVAIKVVPVRGEVAAGRWMEVDEGDDVRHDPIPTIPGKYASLDQFAFKVAGPSMDRAGIYPGSYVVCVPYFEARTRIMDGDRVVIERRRAGSIERTCKQVTVKPDGFELWPRSADPRYQTPLVMRQPESGHAEDGTDVEVVGLVIGTFTPMDG